VVECWRVQNCVPQHLTLWRSSGAASANSMPLTITMAALLPPPPPLVLVAADGGNADASPIPPMGATEHTASTYRAVSAWKAAKHAAWRSGAPSIASASTPPRTPLVLLPAGPPNAPSYELAASAGPLAACACIV
jgi:hypothetical protein